MTRSARGPLELDAEAMRALLAELDERLRERGVSASVYVVGGAAHGARPRRGVTPDIDALASDRAVAEEARAMADDHGLTEHWLNGAAGPWIPLRPKAARRRSTEPGLTVHIAPPEHLLAMKLVALRRKVRPDIRLLIEHLDMTNASAEDYAGLLERVYSGPGRLVTALNIPGDDPEAKRTEALAMVRWAHDSPRHSATATSRSGVVPYSPAGSDRRRVISGSGAAAPCWRRVVRVPTTGGSPGPPCNW